MENRIEDTEEYQCILGEERQVYNAIAMEREELKESIEEGFWTTMGRARQKEAETVRTGAKPVKARQRKAESQESGSEVKASES